MNYDKEEKKKFQNDLKVRIYKWTVRLVKYLMNLSKQSEYSVRSIIDQVMRSGTSTGANYIEAIGAPTFKDFRKYVATSLKSLNESKYWLAIIRDTNIDNSKELHELLEEAIVIANILGKSVSTMYKNDL